MNRILRYITHPQVQIDPRVPVPQWGLSEVGRERAIRFAALPLLSATTTIVSSAETKAVETAEIISTTLGVSVSIREKTHENDRTATGFLEPQEFERVANQFFASPLESARGWEKAVDVQSRITSEAKHIIGKHLHGDLLMVGHGAVGTLLYCHLADVEINRKYDQPGGGGHMFAYDLDSQACLHPWKSIEQVAGMSC